MRILKAIFGFLVSRGFWLFVGTMVLAAIVWFWGMHLKFGDVAPLGDDLARLVAAGLIVLAWLVSLLMKEIRASRANRVFVAELAAEPERRAPGAENVEAIGAKFRSVLAQMKSSKIGGRAFLRDMPWYVIIGPPGTGKTTALRQSGLDFPFDTGEDIHGAGGTRDCDWFFTREAVLVDTAGRYTEQASDREVDAAEWLGFLDLLKKHRGARALNGVIVAISVDELAGPPEALRAHAREIRKRLAEVEGRLGLELPVYLMVTKMDRLAGFEAYFRDLSERDREQVWGVTFAPDAAADASLVKREIAALLGRLEERLTPVLAATEAQAAKAEVFRFPAQVASLAQPLKQFIEAVFAETRYERAAWLRGFYLTSATQVGSPIDRMMAGLAGAFGLDAPEAPERAHGRSRSYFLHDLLGRVIFPEAGLATLDAAAAARRRWMTRGAFAATGLAVAVSLGLFGASYATYSDALTAQGAAYDALRPRLETATQPLAPVERPDLQDALFAVNEVANAAVASPAGLLTALGPSADPELRRAQDIALSDALRTTLEPRMVALLEAAMWQNIRDPDYLLDAFKVYMMVTDNAPLNPDFAKAWWQAGMTRDFAPIDPFPTQAARDYQLAAIDRMAGDAERIAADPELLSAAVTTICSVPLARRAYAVLKSDPEVKALPEFIPAASVRANGARIFDRVSGATLRVGLPGMFTHAGFHGLVDGLIPAIAEATASDSVYFSDGCEENANLSPEALEADLRKLYYDDFIAAWDGFLYDVKLKELSDLRVADENLKDLAGPNSSLRQLLLAVVAETHLTRPAPESGADAGAAGGFLKYFGKAGKALKKGAKVVSRVSVAAPEEEPGAPVAAHFRPIRRIVEEVEGEPPILADVTPALETLSGEIDRILRSPDPDAALVAAGGLAELTGALANSAGGLPEPVRSWVQGIAGGTGEITQEAVSSKLNARWRADVLPFCRSAISGRYPFARQSPDDVNLSDFRTMFGPGGKVESFVETELAPFIDRDVRPWRWRADLSLDPATLAPVEHAMTIRDALFATGAGPVFHFTLTPIDLAPIARRVQLNLGGQEVVYANGQPIPQRLSWPSDALMMIATLTFNPLDEGPAVSDTITGDWAWLRMIDRGSLVQGRPAEVYRLRLGLGGHSADFELRAASVNSPFDRGLFDGFSCAERL